MLDEAAAEILVVDDTPANLKLLTELLTAHGYRVRPATTGELAVRSATAKCPDLVLLDIRLPDLDGFEVCRRIKASQPSSDIPIIFISALHDTAEKLQGFAAGGVDYITKPFAAEEVLARVKTHLELQRLRRDLEQSNREMDARVRERTRELKEANQALRESEERFRSIFNHAPLGISLAHGAEGRITLSNTVFQRMLGYSAEQLQRMTVMEITHPDDIGKDLEQYHALLEDRLSSYAMEKRYVRQDGSLLWVDLTVSAIRDEAGKPVYAVGMVEDITRRKETERALRESEAFLDSIIAQSPLPIVIFDATGKIVRGNQASRTLFDPMAEHDFDERAFFERYNLFQDEQLREQGYATLLERVFHAGETVRFQNRYDMTRLQFPSTARPPRYLDLDSTTFPVKDATGRVTHAVTFHFDITDRKAAEAKLRYHLELEQAVAEISALMIKPGWEDFDAHMNWTLERISRLTRADRGYLFLTKPDGLTTSNTHEWCAPGIAPQLQDLQNLPIADYQPFHDWLERNEVVFIQTSRLPDETALKALLLEGNVRAMICVPINWGGALRGFIGFDAVTADRLWLEEEIRLLRMVAEIIAHTLQHIESDRILCDNARFLEHLDRISRILTRRKQDPDLLADLAAGLLEIFQADRVFFLYPCDPDAATFHIKFEATRPEWPGVFASGAEITPDGVEIVPDDAFRNDLRQTLRHNGPMLSEFTDASKPSGVIRRGGIRSQMVVALYPQSDQPWVLGVQQCAYIRRWISAEQRLFQAIAERVSDALSGHLLLQRLEESENRFAKAFHASPAPMVITIIDTGQFLDANERWMKMLGYTREELIGYTSTEIGLWVDPGTRERMIAQLRRDGFFRDAPVRFRTKTGAILDVLWSAESVRLGEQEVLLTHVYDITDRKRAEAELQRHRDHLEELVTARTAELRQVMSQLMQAEKLAALGNLVAGVAHELNTPLGNTRVVASTLGDDLRGFAAAVESGALRRSQVAAFLDRGREAVDLLERNTARAADLIGHFKQVAVDQTSMRRRRFNLRQITEEILATLQPQFKRTAHRIELEIPSNFELDSYPGPLEQVLANLVNNSLIHGFTGLDAGVIRIHAAALDPDHIQVKYIDNGTGIPENILNRIFDPFFTTRLGSGGSGLGLYIVYNLITGVLGGTIQAHSSPDAGITFTLTLPRIAPDRPPAPGFPP